MTASAKFLQGSTGNQQIIAGKFALDADAQGTVSGDGWSIDRDADNDDNGEYVITIENNNRPLRAAFATYEDDTATIAYHLQVKSFVVSTGVLTLRSLVVDADGADGAGITQDVPGACTIHFMVVLG